MASKDEARKPSGPPHGGGVRIATLAALIFAFSVDSHADAPTRVTVEVTGVADTQGVVVVSLCTRSEFLEHDCRLRRPEPAQTPATAVRFEGVAPGAYAVEAFHDHRSAGHVHQGMLGIPLEGVGFSRNPPLWRKPRFDEVVFDVRDGVQADLAVRLRFERAGEASAGNAPRAETR